MSYSGKFKPKNYKKYKGNPTKIFYRSLWERRFMVYADSNPNIIEWGSEEIVIPYISPLDRKTSQILPRLLYQVCKCFGTDCTGNYRSQT